MIPKIIHYCWFGKKPLPKSAKKCIKSWKKYCPTYKVVLWNEENFPLEDAPLYVRQAYQAKKWAFVTDYVRLWCIYNYGGIYFDTDVELINKIDNFLFYDAFFGFEDFVLDNQYFVNTGLGFGSIKNHQLIKNLLDGYHDVVFIEDNGSINYTPCPQINRMHFVNYGFKMNNSYQCIENVAVFPCDYFCPKNWKTREINITENTVSVHHFDATWRKKNKKKYFIKKLLAKPYRILRQIFNK